MKKLVVMFGVVLHAFLAHADCGRLTATDTYEKLNTILTCIESKIPDTITINNGAIFIPGNYKDARGWQYAISGGGTIGTDRVTWSVRSTNGCLFNAAWTTGPAEGHPQIGALAIAPKLPKNVPFGVMGEVQCEGWKKGGVIAATQQFPERDKTQ